MQARPYDSLESAKLDADQFVRCPDVFARKAPVPAQWGIEAKVVSAIVVKGNPPAQKHTLELNVAVSGDASKIRLWDEECTRTFALADADDHVSKSVGRRYAAMRKAGANG
jgi:hypothetical protein